MSDKKIRLNLNMYYGTEKHEGNWAAVLVSAKIIYKFPTKNIKDIKEVDLFMISFDWNTAYDYVGYFLKKHLKKDFKANVWAHNRYMKYQDEEYFDLAKDLKDVNNYFSINDMYEVTDDSVRRLILEAIKEYKYSSIFLFGSRARNEYSDNSDYDLLLIVEENLSVKEMRKMQVEIRKKLALQGIDADVLVKTKTIVEQYKQIKGNVIYNALKEGVQL